MSSCRCAFAPCRTSYLLPALGTPQLHSSSRHGPPRRPVRASSRLKMPKASLADHSAGLCPRPPFSNVVSLARRLRGQQCSISLATWLEPCPLTRPSGPSLVSPLAPAVRVTQSTVLDPAKPAMTHRACTPFRFPRAKEMTSLRGRRKLGLWRLSQCPDKG